MPSDIVIYQVYGASGGPTSPFDSDYIVLFNRGADPVDLAGWSVQFASGIGSVWTTTSIFSGVIQPGRYFLIQEASGGFGAPLPAPDAVGTIDIANADGKVALVRNAIPLSGVCPLDNLSLVDLVGFGATNCFEGSGPAAAGLPTVDTPTRLAEGCLDTDNNNTDFRPLPPSPRNSSFPVFPCLPPPTSTTTSSTTTSSTTSTTSSSTTTSTVTTVTVTTPPPKGLNWPQP